jgi:DNA-binding NarL/FixJ family response regulator
VRPLPPKGVPLTEKEVRVLELAAQGKNKPQIGLAIYRSPCTVKNHFTRIFAKLDAHNMTQAVAKWLAPERFKTD